LSKELVVRRLSWPENGVPEKKVEASCDGRLLALEAPKPLASGSAGSSSPIVPSVAS
jgi:hypothetical protein